MQLKLELFPKAKQEPIKPFTWYMATDSTEFTEEGYTTYIGRELNEKTGKLETFAIMSGMNFVGQRGNTTFRFLTHRTKERQFQYANDVVLPELNDMSLDDIKSFLYHVLENCQKGYYAWDYENRCKVFTMPCKPELAEGKYTSFQGDRYRNAMLQLLGKEGYVNMVLNTVRKHVEVLN